VNQGSYPQSLAAQNLILAKLPRADVEEFVKRAELVSCTTGHVLQQQGAPISSVYFPASAMVSLLTVLSEELSIESMTVGYEGFVGLPVFHGVKTSQTRAVCQIKGDIFRLSASDFLTLAELSPTLREMLHRYSQFTQDAMAQSAACNSIHLIEQRCARWLLLSADAVRDDHFSLTQEFFAQMLAVRRSGVTTAMGGLERKNLIDGRYGEIKILDREGLETIACQCYDTVKKRLNTLMA